MLDQFTQQATSYARVVNSQSSSNPFDRIAFIGPCAEDNVLDIACGSGSLAISLAEHVNGVTGIDLTPAMIEQEK